jgi:NAD(P)-dependent dehydrogenase (short-subunit alcohol dehydrogenase family)
MPELNGKIAAVSGGTRGIGFSVAEALLHEGAKVFICGRNESHLKTALEKLRENGVHERVDGVTADVSRYQDCRKFVHAAAERFGGLDILVNNAGIGLFAPVDEIAPEKWDELIATNLSGPFYCCREAIPLLRQRGGYIFNISSLAGVNPFAGGAAYNASKFGLNGFSEAMMQDVRHQGIRVSYIMPGSVATDFSSPSGAKEHQNWELTGDDIAKAVVDLCRFPSRALVSRLEIRPSQPPRKK